MCIRDSRWGIQLAISVDVSSPKVVGGLDSFDPLDPKVAEFWRAKTDQIYSLIPDFGGFVVKADSEGRPGPSAYGLSLIHIFAITFLFGFVRFQNRGDFTARTFLLKSALPPMLPM